MQVCLSPALRYRSRTVLRRELFWNARFLIVPWFERKAWQLFWWLKPRHVQYKATFLSWNGTWVEAGAFPWRVGGAKFGLKFFIRCVFCPCGLPLCQLRYCFNSDVLPCTETFARHVAVSAAFTCQKLGCSQRRVHVPKIRVLCRRSAYRHV